jgi:alpha-glucosidase
MPPAAAPTLIALLTSLQGSPCLYQGEELGLTEAVVPYEMLRDPYGIRFWPEFKGRDGCRTPMPWNAAAPHAGFSDAAPWLPVPPDHVDRAVSVQEPDPKSALNRVRRFLAWRRERPELAKGAVVFRDAPEPVVAFERAHDGARTLCAFNLGPEPATLALAPGETAEAAEGAGFGGSAAGGAVALGPWEAFLGALTPAGKPGRSSRVKRQSGPDPAD